MAKFIASISVVPVGTETTSLSKYVAEVIRAFKNANINHELTPMSTIIYSDDLDDILRAIRIAHDTLKQIGLRRIVVNVAIDARHDKPRTAPSDKVKAVMEKL